MKTCNKCGIEKDESEFYFRKDNGKLRNECISCLSEHSRNDYKKNAERNRNYATNYRLNHREQHLAACREWRQNNIEYAKQKDKEKHQKDKERRNKRTREKGEEIRNYVNEIKENNPCLMCGNYYPACAMDFDHIDPNNKEINVCRAGSLRQAKEEIAKCQLLCANCHRIKTYTNKFPIKLKPLRKFVDGYKINVCCVDCKIIFPSVALDFDHLDPSIKISEISNLVSNNVSKEKIWIEIQKCEIRCANCHRIKTFGKRKMPLDKIA